eukprot:4388298-Ditylum_brightwellii.AAC.1
MPKTSSVDAASNTAAQNNPKYYSARAINTTITATADAPTINTTILSDGPTPTISPIHMPRINMVSSIQEPVPLGAPTTGPQTTATSGAKPNLTQTNASANTMSIPPRVVMQQSAPHKSPQQ